MNIGKDQATPRNDMVMCNDGKYLYRITPTRMEVDRFNRDFDQYKERRKKEMAESMQKKLEELNRPEPIPPIYQQSIGKILVDTKDSMFGFLDDILQFKFELSTLTKANRLFYIGLVLLLIAIILYLYDIFMEMDQKPSPDTVEIKHVYQPVQPAPPIQPVQPVNSFVQTVQPLFQKTGAYPE